MAATKVGNGFIHGFNAVAELKHRAGVGAALSADDHPRLQRRGRIEAARRWKRPAKWPVIHGFNAVAELKRAVTCDSPEVTIALIHGFNAVAELKLLLRLRVSRHGPVIHGFNAVAELKLLARLLQFLGKTESSTASTPWPN